MKYLIASFHKGNLPHTVLAAQREVCRHHGFSLLQWQSTLTHGEAIEECLAAHGEWEVVCLLDADAFCRDAAWLWATMERVAASATDTEKGGQRVGMVGGAHNANHRLGSADYASPACCILSRVAYDHARRLGCPGFPNFNPHDGLEEKDVGQHLSDTLRVAGYAVELLYPRAVRVPRWRLMNGEMFGNGTDYGPFYHEFESRMGNEASPHLLAKVAEELGKPPPEFFFPPSDLEWRQPQAQEVYSGYTHIFVLSLARARNRRLSVLRQLIPTGHHFEMIDAIDALAVKPEVLAVPAGHWLLKPGEVACYLSHIGMLQRIVDYDLAYAIILEDDMRLTGEGALALETIWDHLPPNADHVQLHNMGNKVVDVGHRIYPPGETQHFQQVRPTSAMTVG